MRRGLTPDLYRPVVITGLKQMVTSLNVADNGPDDLTAGCQPFMLTYTGPNNHYHALDNAMVASQLDQGMAQASLVDIRDISQRKREEGQNATGLAPSKPHPVAICLPSVHTFPGAERAGRILLSVACG